MENRSTIREKAREVVEDFALFDDWLGKYEYLIELGRSVPEIEEGYKTDQYKIRGCQSQVWIRPELRDGILYFKGDSDALITKGLVALLLRVLSGHTPTEIAEADVSFIDEIGMTEHLSPTRKNGLSAMIKQIKLYGLAHSQLLENPGEALIESPPPANQADETLPSKEDLEAEVIEVLRTVYDPEIPLNIYDLGLIYEIRIHDDRSVFIKMTLTAPNCPVADILPQQVESAVATLPDVRDARVQLTFDPPFSIEMMSDEAKLTLGFM